MSRKITFTAKKVANNIKKKPCPAIQAAIQNAGAPAYWPQVLPSCFTTPAATLRQTTPGEQGLSLPG